MGIYTKLQIVAIIFLSLFLFVSQAKAAAPDGSGPWADSVHSVSQGLMKNGNAVPAIRSNPTSALGIAEDNTADGNFFSLGFGGNIALGFDNGISSGVIIIEATNPGYPTERAKIEVSENGVVWVNAGIVSQDGSVNKPKGLNCVRYVRVTDISSPNDFSDATADGYDVDGVKATGKKCPKPHGSHENSGSDCTTTVKQENIASISTAITLGINTGGNSATKNTKSSSSINTGNVIGIVSSSTTANSNVANVQNCNSGNINLNSTPKKYKN